MLDPVKLTQDLIRCPSITPEEGGALTVLENTLRPLGFTCHRITFEEAGTPPVENLYARIGTTLPNICFAGHTDVVPVGDQNQWTHDPFAAEISGGMLYGRGAEDMKAAIACFITASERYIRDHPNLSRGAISLLITGDEEGPAINGTRKMLPWLEERGETLDACIVGEPTNPETLGQMIKIGRRGSIMAHITAIGTQGHVAYPHLAKNPVSQLVEVLQRLQSKTLDEGTEYFQPSNLEITTIDVGNPADNVIPGKARASLNIRFNNTHTAASLQQWIGETVNAVDGEFEVRFRVTGEAFITKPGPLSNVVSRAITEVTGITPELSTTGGTSDARFIKDICPVVEFGATGKTAHKIDECIAVKDIHTLTDIYTAMLEEYFS